jgi:hypothetical protein
MNTLTEGLSSRGPARQSSISYSPFATTRPQGGNMNSEKLNVAEMLNRDCDCAVTDLPWLRTRIESVLEGAPSILKTHPHLFSEIPVFLDRTHLQAMQEVIDGIEATIRLPLYRDAVLENAPEIARIDSPTEGVFMGFDFHIAHDGPKLIEINTNAGGALLNIAAQGAQRACCDAANDALAAQPSALQLEDDVVSMFVREWSLARGTNPLRTIAIVDENPREQFLHLEFQLAKKLFESRGIRAHIVDPSDLVIARDALWFGDEQIDLVYNRLTDFYLETPRNEVLRTAYERDLAVITPHPQAHALYADKRNLTLLSDPAVLEQLGATPGIIATLTRGIPSTREVSASGEGWWKDRKAWFFKPRTGFGSRGAYRGDKLTRRVFADIVSGEYIAQANTPPSERWRSMSGIKEGFKVDVRCYVYRGTIQLLAARLYQGQTTNFRTAGGGFAPVYVVGGSLSGPSAAHGIATALSATPCAGS